ncbi:MAG: hypothetical protein M1833_007051 [Piccolia ochrophora]|nr:MAG: hypothetical protein M1833_007051 [Piccolia ochrophora]
MSLPNATSEKPSATTDHSGLAPTLNEATSASPARDAIMNARNGADVPTGEGQGANQGTRQRREEDKSEVEKAAEKLYEERMEDEYAKREGGA